MELLELCVPRLPGNKPTLYSQPSLWGVRSSDIFPMKCQEPDREIPGGAGGAHPTSPLFSRAQSDRRTGAGYSSFPPTLWPWLEPAHELSPPQFPSSEQAASHSKKHLGGQGREMLRGGTRQAAGMITPPPQGLSMLNIPGCKRLILLYVFFK